MKYYLLRPTTFSTLNLTSNNYLYNTAIEFNNPPLNFTMSLSFLIFAKTPSVVGLAMVYTLSSINIWNLQTSTSNSPNC